MSASFVIDCGSRSIKLHSAAPGGAVSLRATRSWNPITDAAQADRIADLFAELAGGIDAEATIHVVGTAAARRDPRVASAIATASKALGWSYETLTQAREAELIRAAFAGLDDIDIVNAGGGSIQIVEADGTVTLLGFGISDLNRQFGLDQAPASRRIAEATAFIRAQLPPLCRPFVYSGGELTYLRALGAEVDAEGRCASGEFLRVAATIDAMPAAEQERVSPFDAGWTGGAVASNAIVRACLDVARVPFYVASDVNIADGIISSLAGRISPTPPGGREKSAPGAARAPSNRPEHKMHNVLEASTEEMDVASEWLAGMTAGPTGEPASHRTEQAPPRAGARPMPFLGFESEAEARRAEEAFLSLSGREATVLAYLAYGNSAKEVAHKLNLSCRTVDTFRTRALLKLRARNTADAVRMLASLSAMAGLSTPRQAAE